MVINNAPEMYTLYVLFVDLPGLANHRTDFDELSQ